MRSRHFEAEPGESTGATYHDRSGAKTERGWHAGPFEIGGKMKIGFCFRHVRVFFWRGG
jgi:hypothetical protein